MFVFCPKMSLSCCPALRNPLFLRELCSRTKVIVAVTVTAAGCRCLHEEETRPRGCGVHVTGGTGLCKSARRTQAFTTEDVGASRQSEADSPGSRHPRSDTALDLVARMCNMTFEETSGENSSERFVVVILYLFIFLFAF